jgi:murein DD-endopeptidase MepM/ murein hydrolase activator NlpD
MAKKITLFLTLFICAVALFPERVTIPVKGATRQDWHSKSFWYEPWGTSGVHKGIDVFAKKGTDVVSTTDGIVLFTGNLPKGGNVIAVLGPGWKIHYFAHLDLIDTTIASVVTSGATIGTVGDSGNAKGKPAHLHYAIVRMYPVPWEIDQSTQGYKKAFFIDPGAFLREKL